MKVVYSDGMYTITESLGDQELKINGGMAAEMVRQLYLAGLEFDMPTDQTYLAGELEATKKHLADMRRLVMDGLPGDKE